MASPLRGEGSLVFIYFIMIPFALHLSIQTGHTNPKREGDTCAKTKSRAVYPGGRGGGAAAHRHPGGVGRVPAACHAGVRVFPRAGYAGVRGACCGLRCRLRSGRVLQDARGPRFAGLWGTALLAGGFFAAAFVPPANAALFLVVYSVPAGLGSAFLAPAVLACAQKWYQDKKGWATGVAGSPWGCPARFLRCSSRVSAGRGASGSALPR